MLTDFIEKRMGNPVLWKEFGLDSERETETRARVHERLADWLTQCRAAGAEITRQMDSRELDTMKEVTEMLTGGNPDGNGLIFSVSGEEGGSGEEVPADAQQVFEVSGWEHVSEWIGDIPDPGSGKHDYYLFRVRRDSPVSDPGFPTLMLAVMDARYGAIQGGMDCRISLSDDGANHFSLLRK